RGRNHLRLTGAAYARMVVLGGLVATGIFRVLKNLPDVTFSPGFTLFIDISHLGFMMVFGLLALVFKALGKGWVVQR
ncbi:MAG: FeS-binding protein, partial [Deltaproteobacteria bacterium]|nr:FeS-binding protein [Deltaproteobacteria bacterium]